MRSMTKINLTLDSFIQNVIDEIHRKSVKTPSIEDVVLHKNDQQVIEALYNEGINVGRVADTFASNYYALDRVSRR
jgi:hypothetical protein